MRSNPLLVSLFSCGISKVPVVSIHIAFVIRISFALIVTGKSFCPFGK